MHIDKLYLVQSAACLTGGSYEICFASLSVFSSVVNRREVTAHSCAMSLLDEGKPMSILSKKNFKITFKYTERKEANDQMK